MVHKNHRWKKNLAPVISNLKYATVNCVSQVCKKANKRARVSLLKILEEMKKYIELGENGQFRPPNFSIDKS